MDSKKKLDPPGQDLPEDIVINVEDNLSRRSRKSPNSYSTHTQRHRSPCENEPALDLCFEWSGRGDFFNRK